MSLEVNEVVQCVMQGNVY